jgi:hypothetical protein
MRHGAIPSLIQLGTLTDGAGSRDPGYRRGNCVGTCGIVSVSSPVPPLQWRMLCRYLTRQDVLAAGCVAVDSSAIMDCPVNGVNGVHSLGGVVLDHLSQEGCFSSHVADGASYFVGDSASCHVKLGQLAWKSGYLGQIIINVGSNVGSCKFVSRAVELGLEPRSS